MKFWDQFQTVESAELAWDKQECEARAKSPLKVLKTLPEMPGITAEAAKNLKWKSLKWMIRKDRGFKIFSSVIKKPIFHLTRFLKSIFSAKSFKREGDFFLYGIDRLEDFKTLLKKKNTLFILGFSYCHKPFECPSGRFTDACIHDSQNPVCRQCFIGKCVHASPEKATIPVYIPTVHYIGNKVFELIKKHPEKQVIFLITACEMTLTMFADYGNMAGIKGVGVRLDGRICNTLKAFELSEEGVKPGLTVVLDEAKRSMLDWIYLRKTAENNDAAV